jgi:cytochrome c biogenesis protein
VKTTEGFSRIVKWLWRVFSSVRLAVTLILVLTCSSLIGTFVAPVEFFHSGWFLAPGILLVVSILICNMNRWKNIRALISGGKVKQPEHFFTESESKCETVDCQLSPVRASPKVASALRTRGYRVRSENEGDRVYLAADKNRYFKLGTYASHLSLILFVLAYIIGTGFGFRDTSFTIAEGQTKEVGHSTGLSLSLISFTDEYYSDNTPKDFRSQVILYKNGQEMDQALIRVNQPLIYEGTRFYQSFFGPAVGIRVTENGGLIFQGNVALSLITESQGYRRYAGYLDLTGENISVRFTSSAINFADPMIPAGHLAVEIRQEGEQVGFDLLDRETPLEIAGLEFTYQNDAQYSGFQVSRDPGNMLIWIASSLLLIGMTLVLFFVHRQLWVLIRQSGTDGSRVYLRMLGRRGFNNSIESEKIVSAIDKELSRGDKI